MFLMIFQQNFWISKTSLVSVHQVFLFPHFPEKSSRLLFWLSIKTFFVPTSIENKIYEDTAEDPITMILTPEDLWLS